MTPRSTARLLGLALLIGCGSRGSSASSTSAVATPSSNPGPLDTTESHVAAALQKINASRATRNLPPLALDPVLGSCALRHAEDCASCAGGDPARFATCAHGDWNAGDMCGGTAENQGVASGLPEDEAFARIHDAMMAEGPPPPGQDNHFSNLMSSGSTTVGIGLFVDAQGTLWTSEEFR